MKKQISEFLPEVKDRYFIDDKGKLYTDYGQKLMKDSLQYKDYIKNQLVNKDGSQKGYFRHRLVMICFNYRDDYKNYQVNHIDGNKLNNSVENLEWCTNQENRIHAVKTGLAKGMNGETNPYHKLTESEVLEIIDHIKNHTMSYSKLAKKYNVSKSTIAAIKAKRNWQYLTKDIEFD